MSVMSKLAFLAAAALFAACSANIKEGESFFLTEGLAPKKQKLRIANLQRKLDTVKAEQFKIN